MNISSQTSLYLAGPMRGHPRFNFDAFDDAARCLRKMGYAVVSPAEIDRELGFDPDKHDEGFFDFGDMIRRDVEAVLSTDATVLLPGWEKSKGANAEVAIARWAGKQILVYPSLLPLDESDVFGLPVFKDALGEYVLHPKTGRRIDKPLERQHVTFEPLNTPDECILDEAARLTRGDRQAQYGPPDQDFARTAAMWSALKGVPFEPREVAMFMVCLKLSREQHQRKRDNWVDIAGYARCGSLCRNTSE